MAFWLIWDSGALAGSGHCIILSMSAFATTVIRPDCSQPSDFLGKPDKVGRGGGGGGGYFKLK